MLLQYSRLTIPCILHESADQMRLSHAITRTISPHSYTLYTPQLFLYYLIFS